MAVLIFGDSITQGAWDSQGGWAQRLMDDYVALQMQDLEVDVPVLFNLGISGNKTTDILERLESETKARNRRQGELFFVFAIGTNDSYVEGKEPVMTPEQYVANLEAIIEKAQQFAPTSKLLFVGLQPCNEAETTPVSWRDVTYTNERLQLFDQKLQAVCAKHSIAYVPIFDIFQKRQAEQDMLIDGLHPDDAGHRLMYEQIKPALQALIKNS